MPEDKEMVIRGVEWESVFGLRDIREVLGCNLGITQEKGYFV